jgi:perosamine synthetase
MSEFHASLLLAQLQRLPQQAQRRDDNAARLTAMLDEIPGIHPARGYDGCTRNAYHLYMLRYDKDQFDGLPRARFLRALSAEGIPASGGYTPLNKEPFLQHTLQSRAYKYVYSSEQLAGYEARNDCPVNDKLCEEAVWFTQTMLLGPKSDMDQIAEAIRKIQAHAEQIAQS